MRLVLATSNSHKLVELAEALPGWAVEALDGPVPPPETGSTYLDNARAKAHHARTHGPVDAWAAGEDSGIEAVGLDGAPGVRSARWAVDGVGQMLFSLDGIADRRARYVCALVVVDPDGREIVVEGTLDGEIADRARGDGGFGYDPIFIPVGETRTVAELGDAWKRAHSHRARAAAALAALVGTG